MGPPSQRPGSEGPPSRAFPAQPHCIEWRADGGTGLAQLNELMIHRFPDGADRTLVARARPRGLPCLVGSIAVVAVVVVISGCGGHGKAASTSSTTTPAQQAVPGTLIAGKLQQQLLTGSPGIYVKDVRCPGSAKLGGSIVCTGTLAGGRKVSVHVLVSGTAAAPTLKIATTAAP